MSILDDYLNLNILCRVVIPGEEGSYVFFTDGTYIHTETFNSPEERSEWLLMPPNKLGEYRFYYRHTPVSEWQCDHDSYKEDKIIIEALLLELSIQAMLTDK